MDRLWIALGALLGLATVAAAAAAAHVPGLGTQAARDAIQIMGWHAPALLFAGIFARRGGLLVHLAALAFAAGTAMFAGAIFALALQGIRLPNLAPSGGMTLLGGWALLFLAALRAR